MTPLLWLVVSNASFFHLTSDAQAHGRSSFNLRQLLRPVCKFRSTAISQEDQLTCAMSRPVAYACQTSALRIPIVSHFLIVLDRECTTFPLLPVAVPFLLWSTAVSESKLFLFFPLSLFCFHRVSLACFPYVAVFLLSILIQQTKKFLFIHSRHNVYFEWVYMCTAA